MRIENEILLDFDDVLIKPKRSEAPSRASIDLTRDYSFLYSDLKWKGIPIIAANMSTTGTLAMARVLSKFGAMTCLHKFYDLDVLEKFYREFEFEGVFYTLGIKDEDIDKLKSFLSKVGYLPYICIDAANGYTKYFVDKVKEVRKLCPKSVIMAGNVCTAEMVQELILSGGADVIKIGIGGGSACSTRIATAVGYPQLSAIIECADAAHGLKGHIAADGGCRNSGHVVRAFGAGADFVMLGGMFAGTDECEGEWTYLNREVYNYNRQGPNDDYHLERYGMSLDGTTYVPTDDESLHLSVKSEGQKFKLKFYGMSSEEAMDKFYGGKKDYVAPEGVSMEVPYKGSAEKVIQEVLGGLRSACTYVGTSRLKDFSKCCTFVRVNRVHDLRK